MTETESLVAGAETASHPEPQNRQGLPIEDYALIGDRRTAALVGRDGAIDWLCLPRFDSPACFAALLGDSRNGHWRIAPTGPYDVTRAYREDTLVLETVFTTPTGSVALIDFMAAGESQPRLIRIVQGRTGHVAMAMRIMIRFDFGMSVPWVTRLENHHGICAIAGPSLVTLHTPAKLTGRDMSTTADFTIHAGQEIPFTLSYGPSHLPAPAPIDPHAALAATEADWKGFMSRCHYTGPYAEPVRRSLLTLRALTYAPTGGIVAAATTSLPEQLGGSRNWDYRYCWLRDATIVLMAFMHAGYTQEAAAWRDWLQRSIAGSPEQIQIMYGIEGERRIDEWEVPWLTGYQGAAPVRIGNAAAGQVQLDVYGEVLECLHLARRHGLRPPPHGWSLQRGIVEHLMTIWDSPDEGIWEVRGGARQFTFSKISAWVALDRMIHDATHFHLSGDVAQWRTVRDQIRDEVLTKGFDATRNTFTQSFGSQALDASLLLIPQMGFLPATDPRVIGTVAAIERELMDGGFVQRYSTTKDNPDGLPPGEGAFLACSFWLADAYHQQGRKKDAEALFNRLLALRNDVGLLSEEYDPRAKRQVGNFPQAFSHVALLGTAMALSGKNALRRHE
jgi:glucoamylase